MDGPYWTPAIQAMEVAQAAQESAWNAQAWANSAASRPAKPAPAAEPVQSEVPEGNGELIPGKRYRLTVLADVDPVGRLCNVQTGDLLWNVPETAVESVELLPDPLPTTPGSVITKNTYTYVRAARTGEVGQRFPWTPTNIDTGSSWYSDDELTGARVLFDAGASRD